MNTFKIIQNQINNLYLVPDGSGCTIQFTSFGAVNNWQCVDDPVGSFNDSDYVISSTVTGTQRDIYDVIDHTDEYGTINYIEVNAVARCYPSYMPTTDQFKVIIDDSTCGSPKASRNMNRLCTQFLNYKYAWRTNPYGGNWAWADVDAFQVGIEHYRTSVTTSYYLHVTQCYMKVNYTSEVTCYLNMPEAVSTNHSNNIKIFNMWNGTREVYSLNRSKKSMVLSGREFEQNSGCTSGCPCEKITCVRDMGISGVTVTLSNLPFCRFNGDFKIRKFGWKHRSVRPSTFDWILELESDGV